MWHWQEEPKLQMAKQISLFAHPSLHLQCQSNHKKNECITAKSTSILRRLFLLGLHHNLIQLVEDECIIVFYLDLNDKQYAKLKNPKGYGR